MKRSLFRRLAVCGLLLLVILALALPVAAAGATTSPQATSSQTGSTTQPTQPEKTNTDIFDLVSKVLALLNPTNTFNAVLTLLLNWVFSQAVDLTGWIYNSLTSTLNTAFFNNAYIKETQSFFQWLAGILLTFGFVCALFRLLERSAHGEPVNPSWMFFSAAQAYGMILFCKPVMFWLNEVFYELAEKLTYVSITVNVSKTMSHMQPGLQSQIVRSLIIVIIIVVVSCIVLFKALQRFVVIYIQTATGYFYVFDLMHGNNTLGEWGRDVISGFVTFGFQYCLYRIGMVLILQGADDRGDFINFTNSNFVVGLCFLLGVGAVSMSLRRWGYANQPSGIKQALGQAVSFAGGIASKLI